MINKTFWDIDNTLIFSDLRELNQKHIRFALEDGGIYYTVIRPCAKRVIDFSRSLVGEENVYILTTSTKDYASEINRLAEFNFKPHQIIAREDLRKHNYATAYGGSSTVPSELAHENNVLIDNLPSRDNSDKISFLGIWKNLDSNYFKVDDYYGVNRPDDPFEENVKNFLTTRHKFGSQECKKLRDHEEKALEVQAG